MTICKGLIILVLLLGCVHTRHLDDLVISKKDTILIKRKLIKNKALGSILLKKQYVADEANLKKNIYESQRGMDAPFQFPGFGFWPDDIDFSIRPLAITYPDKRWKLFEASFLESTKNDSLVAWSHEGLTSLSFMDHMLIGIDENKEVKFISCGMLLEHRIAGDFKLRPDNPRSYIPFLSLKTYRFRLDDISFVGREGHLLVFKGVRSRDDGLIVSFRIVVDPERPEPIKMKYTGDMIIGHYPPRPKLNFKDLNDKKRYLFNALMKNIYMYRIHHLEDLENVLGVDTNEYFHTDGPSKIDSILPDYDEYLTRMDLVKVHIWKNGESCKGAWSEYQGLLSEGRTWIVGNTTHDFGDIEFYRIYKDKEDYLFRQSSWPSRRQQMTGRHDLYYSPERKKEHDQWMDQSGHPPPPPEPIPANLHDGYPNCAPYGVTLEQRWKQLFDYYLIALDVKTREVFFVSGKDIYLTKSVHLYPPGEKKPPPSIKDWELRYKLDYIKDRLYCYQVTEVSEKNIVSQNDRQMVLKVNGEEYGQQTVYQVTFRNRSPEILKIEKL